MNLTHLPVLLALCFSSCRIIEAKHNRNNSFDATGSQRHYLRVYKIDSVNNFYLIYAKNTKSFFKIISEKKTIDNCRNIYIKGKYNFSLTSIWNYKMFINGVNVSPSTNLLVNCLAFDSVTYICLERDSINDLYHANNIEGLCLTRK